jgi:hypothetical protein
MATKLNVNTGGEDIGKKLWDRHQKNEFTKVNNYKEAVCLGCLKKDVAAATIATICGDCSGVRGREALLATVSHKYYGLCLFCGKHKFNLEEINARFCMTCHRKIANVTKEYNKKGGIEGTDPFWLKIKKQHGKDWKALFNQGWTKK